MGGWRQFHQYCLQHPLRLQQDIIVPEPQHAKPGRLQLAISLLIIGSLIEMLPAVELDYHARLQAGEVRHMAGYRDLSAKPGSCELQTSEIPSKMPLGICCVVAQRTRTSLQDRPGESLLPPPQPSPVRCAHKGGCACSPSRLAGEGHDAASHGKYSLIFASSCFGLNGLVT